MLKVSTQRSVTHLVRLLHSAFCEVLNAYQVVYILHREACLSHSILTTTLLTTDGRRTRDIYRRLLALHVAGTLELGRSLMCLGVIDEHLLRVGMCRHLQRIIHRHGALLTSLHGIKEYSHAASLCTDTRSGRVAVRPRAVIVETTTCIVEELVVLTLRGHVGDTLYVVPLTHYIGRSHTLGLQNLGHTSENQLGLLGNILIQRSIDTSREHLAIERDIILVPYDPCCHTALNSCHLGSQCATQGRLGYIGYHRRV